MPDRSKDDSPSKQSKQQGSSGDLERFVVLDPAVETFRRAMHNVLGSDAGPRVWLSPLAPVGVLRVLLAWQDRLAFKVLREARRIRIPKRPPGRPRGRRSTDPSEAFFLAQAVHHNIPKAKILRAVGRETTKGNYNWLARRVAQARADGVIFIPLQLRTEVARRREAARILAILKDFRQR